MKSTPIFPRPNSGDSPDYYFTYIDKVPDVDILTYLHTQRDWIGDWIETLTDEQLQYSYAPGKWTLAEMIGHILDSERIFAYRMLAMSRADENKLPGFDQDVYVANSIYNTFNAEELANDWRAARSSSIYLCRSINAEMATRMGTANNYPFKTSAFPYILAGHVMHHYNVAKERYLGEA